LRCRLYSTSLAKPHQVAIPTRCANLSHKAQHFPVPESMLQGACLQPYVHSCQVTVHEAQHTYWFCIFFKQHCYLPLNPALSAGGSLFQGDAAIMQLGEASHVVNMRGRDVAIADFMMAW
ncbi:hypothetical protein EDD17DRAFT_1489529, partial [Pisolithus thermaeus]